MFAPGRLTSARARRRSSSWRCPTGSSCATSSTCACSTKREALQKAPRPFQDRRSATTPRTPFSSRATSPCATPGSSRKDRYQRNIDELNEHLRDAAKILIDITAAQRNQLDQAIAGEPGHAAESKANIVKPDEEHVIWPFNGEYWRDELGFYSPDDHLEVREVI